MIKFKIWSLTFESSEAISFDGISNQPSYEIKTKKKKEKKEERPEISEQGFILNNAESLNVLSIPFPMTQYLIKNSRFRALIYLSLNFNRNID